MSINGDSPSQSRSNGSHRNGNWKNSGHNSSLKSTRSNNQTNMQKDYAMRQKSRESRRGNDFKIIKTRYNSYFVLITPIKLKYIYETNLQKAQVPTLRQPLAKEARPPADKIDNIPLPKSCRHTMKTLEETRLPKGHHFTPHHLSWCQRHRRHPLLLHR